MRGALRSRYGITRDTIVFDTKKEAQETMKNHPCNKNLKYVILNKKQIKYINIIKNAKENYFMNSETFLSLK